MAFNLAMALGFTAVSAGMLLVILTFGWFIRPSNPTVVKSTTYECGEVPVGAAWFNFNNRFYIIALVFVVFDVEVALTIPAVLVFRRMLERGEGLLAFAEIFFFLAILLFALVYVWARGDLDWIRFITDPKKKAETAGGKAP